MTEKYTFILPGIVYTALLYLRYMHAYIKERFEFFKSVSSLQIK